MKKFLIGLCLSSVLLAGCQKEKSTYVAKEDKIAISTTDFKDEDALRLVESVLKNIFHNMNVRLRRQSSRVTMSTVFTHTRKMDVL